MLNLLGDIFCNAILFILFKRYAKYDIDNLQAIVANYWTCVITGSLVLGSFPISGESLQQPWSPWSIGMGALFFTVFNLLAYSTLKDGITTTTVANKLSLVIPVICAVFLYNDKLTAVKLAGILIAFPAVYLTTRIEGEGQKKHSLFWPAMIFIGSGLLDALVKYTEYRFITNTDELVIFTIHIFAAAGTVGLLVVAVQLIRRKIKLHYKNIIAGILLGVPNYFSIYFFIRFLRSGIMQSSAAIPVANIGIVLVSALAAIIFFREKTTRMRVIGLTLSILSILLIAFGDMNGTGI